jgi:C4-dicarboxylate-specific signal transduction histidine kinase
MGAGMLPDVIAHTFMPFFTPESLGHCAGRGG